MSQAVQLEMEMPGDLAKFRLPAGVQRRLLENELSGHSGYSA